MTELSGLKIALGTRSKHTAWMSGDPRQAKAVLKQLAVGHLWDYETRCWMFSVRRVDAVVAWETTHGRYVEIVAVDR